MTTSCAYCNQVTGEPNGQCYFRISNELVWHSNCFKCEYGNGGTVGCRSKLHKKNSKILNSTPYCFACYELALYRENCKQNINLFEDLNLIINPSTIENLKEQDDIKIEFEEKPIVPPADNINICFVGGVSTGKSTILNAIFCEELTQCKIKRTTMVPTIYIENESNPFNITP